MSKHDWETQTQEVLPAVFRVPLPLPGDHLKAVNVYVIVDGDRLALIDAGWALEDSERQLDRSLATLGFQLADIREFLVTHVHRDHYTQAVALRRRFGSHVSLGEGEQVTLDAIHSIDVDPQIDRMEIAGAAELARQLRLEDDFAAQQDLANFEYPNRWLHDRNELTLKTRTLSVIATPGHTRGHVVFHDPNAGALFAGDHVLPHITPSVGVELIHGVSPLRDYMTSLRLMLALPDTMLLPAHGPTATSTHARVEELLNHHDERLTEIANAVVHGATTGFEVANRIRWTRRGRHFGELDLFNQVLAVNETVAHLQVLVERKWLRHSTVEIVDHYAVA